ncbi:MAG: pilus assembly protein TadG-related protein [Candidatus Dormibacterales bacterium]
MKNRYSTSLRRQSGQILPIAAAGFLVLAAIAGLAIDASRDYLVKRDAQNAVDFAALAAAKEMTLSGNLSVALSSGSNAVIAAHDFAANNGFPTNYNTTCDSTAGGGFTTTWFDATGLPCAATSGFTNKVTLNSPAQALPGAPVPPVCTGTGTYSCVQVVITTSVSEIFTSVLGIKSVYITVGASAHAILPGSNINAPWPSALVLYEPITGCSGSMQCFNESKPVSRTQLSCDPTKTAANNCPTLWAATGSNPVIKGYDGTYFNPAQDVTAVQSNGDVVIQARTTICDPYNVATCVTNGVVGTAGLAVAPGSKIYCSKFGTGAAHATACTTTGQAGLAELDTNQTNYISPAYWAPSITRPVNNCGSLVLNGQKVYGPCANATEQYLIEPGIYSSIVINHGTYEFDQGIYDITGVAPVNTLTSGGYTANGIDHTNEVAADFDLCTPAVVGVPNAANACPNLTAGVWIGHGAGSFSAYVAPTSSSCNGSASGGANGGGGDPTIVSGNATVFLLDTGSGGFVVTHEVTGVNFAGAGVNSNSQAGNSPIFIDMENGSFVHLDGSAPGGGGASSTSVLGQVLAYSFTTFGTSGTLDFSQGYGAGTVPGIATSGKNETSIISSATLTASTTPGYEILTVNYTDEWAMDAYDQFIKENNGQPVFFSQGIWNPVPSANATIPPPGNVPGDQVSPVVNVRYPSFATTYAAAYTQTSTVAPASPSDIPNGSADWTYAIPSSNGATIEVSGQWTWGHEKDLSNSSVAGQPVAQSQSNIATVKYTFPIPTGSYVALAVFVVDGDRCGDYAFASYTFKNVGAPGPGQQTVGSVDLAQ